MQHTTQAQQMNDSDRTLLLDEAMGIPLIGLIHVGVIDRGSNLLQVRMSTACNMSCTFCSTDAGPYSKLHKKNVLVDPDYLLRWLREVIRLKGIDNIEVNIDSVGEPTAYPHLIQLIEGIRKLPEVKTISMQTNGTLLTQEKIVALDAAGLNRLNLSVHALDAELAKYLFGNHAYNVDKIKEMIAFARKNTKIEVNLTPVYLPGVNEKEIPCIIQFAKENEVKISIQKYEFYKFSRKDRGAERISWFHFYRQLEAWEKEFGMKLKIGPRDFNIVRTRKIPLVFQRGDCVLAEVKASGWFPNELIAVAKNRAITIVDCAADIGDRIKVKIMSAENSLYLAKKV